MGIKEDNITSATPLFSAAGHIGLEGCGGGTPAGVNCGKHGYGNGSCACGGVCGYDEQQKRILAQPRKITVVDKESTQETPKESRTSAKPTAAQIEEYIHMADLELGPECCEPWVEWCRATLRAAVDQAEVGGDTKPYRERMAHIYDTAARALEDLKKHADAEITELRAILAAQSASVDRFKEAYMEWSNKTEWVQDQANTFHTNALGKHRADVMREEIERLRSVLAQRAWSGEAKEQGNDWKDALRRSGANTDYHGLIAFTGKQFEHFIQLLAPPSQPDIERDVPAVASKLSLQQVADRIDGRSIMSPTEFRRFLNGDGVEMYPYQITELANLFIQDSKRDAARIDFHLSQHTTWYEGRGQNGNGILCYGFKRQKVQAATWQEAIDAAMAAQQGEKGGA